MTYLNNVENGGTEFYYQNLRVEAKKGLTLICELIGHILIECC